jgi:uncharacterized protein
MSVQPTSEQIREFVIAGHGDLAKVKAMLADQPGLLNIAYPWREDDHETAIQGAAHVGNRAIAEYLLTQGAPLDICTAAMLGRKEAMEQMVQADANALQRTGAHGIPLLTHAAFSGNLALMQWLIEQGVATGIASALHNAVSRGHSDLVNWLLQNSSPDLSWKNFQGKTALTVALENQNEGLVQLLRDHGATE